MTGDWLVSSAIRMRQLPMTTPLPNLRYERKFVAQGSTLAEVLAGVRRHSCSFREVYPPRIVNNIYFDSPARRDYHEHINGVASRTKTRVRWYGQNQDMAECPRLERKLKRGSVSGKEAYDLAPLRLREGCRPSLFEAAFDSAALPPMLRSTLRHLEPALCNSYHRHYFLSHDARIRLTLDSCLRFCSVSHHRSPAGWSFHTASTVIIELKFAPEFAEHASLVTNALPFRMTRFSKYVVGIESI